jgi:hypothetical protein
LLYKKYSGGLKSKNISQFLEDLINTKRFIELKIDLKTLEKKLRNYKRTITYNEVILIIINEFFSINFKNEKLVGIKNPNSFLHIPFIYSIFPNAKIFILVRDPRSILASEKVKRLKTGNYNSSEYIWNTYRRFTILSKNLKLHKDKIKEIYYEQMIINLKSTTLKLCEFLEIDWHENLINYYHKSESLPSYDLSQHKLSLLKPDKSRIVVYNDTLTNDETTILEFLLNKEMKQHNYVKSNKTPSFLFYYKLLKVLIFGIRQFFLNRLKF